MGRSAKRILISGYYGFDNSGDEAVLLSILQALKEQEKQGITIQPIVLSNDPDTTSVRYGTASVHRMKPAALMKALLRCDGVISGGGSLLQDVTGRLTIPYYLGILRFAQLLGKPTFIYSQGIGPVNRPKFHKWIRTTLSRARYVSVRDEQSAEYLFNIGLAKEMIEVVPDPVMGLEAGEEKGSKSADPHHERSEQHVPVIGVSVRFWEQNHSDLNCIAETLVKVLKKRKAVFRFLPFHEPDDEQASQEVIRLMKELVNNDGESGKQSETSPELNIDVVTGQKHPLQMAAQVGNCDVMVGMRLHSLIYAASQLVPVAGISYDPKIDHFLNRIDMMPIGSTKSLNTEEAANQILDLIDHREQWIVQKKEKILALKRKSQIPAQQIGNILRNSV